jgi:hypothetical protein
MGKIGNSMGKLKSVAGTAFKALAAGAAAAAAAIGAMAIQAIKSAAEDEQSTIRLNAALKARGFAIKELTPAINEQIVAAQRLGFTDDQVRAALETGSRFFKDRQTLLKSLPVAENIAAATGKDLADVQMILGKAVLGQTRGLKTLGIEVKKGATAQDIFTAANAKYAGIADELANSTAGKFTAAQIAFSEQIEGLGYRLLPAVSDAMSFLGTTVLPITDAAFKSIGDAITSAATEMSKPGGMLESVGAVAGEFFNSMKPGVEAVASALGPFIQAVLDLAGALWGDGKGPLAVAVTFIGEALNNLMLIIKPVLDILTAIINAINGVITGAAKLGDNPANNQGFQFSGGAVPSAGGGYTYGGTGTGGGITIKNNISFGQDAVSFIDTSLGRTISRGSTRTAP